MVASRAFPNCVGLNVSSFNARLIHFFRIFLYPDDINFKLLRKSTLYCGYNPRECFRASYSVTGLEAKMSEVMMRISFIAIDTDHILQALQSYQMGDDAIFDAFFHFFPNQ